MKNLKTKNGISTFIVFFLILSLSTNFQSAASVEQETPGAAPSETPGAAPSETPGAAPSETPGAAPSETPEAGQGGCLIATASFGSELAPQVQLLRETRDNVVMQTQSGAVFMTAFNSVYYSFAPTIADWERQNPVFKEAVKITITPLLTTLSILNYVDIDSEAEMLGYGIGVILLNIGMYFVAPVFVIYKIRNSRLS